MLEVESGKSRKLMLENVQVVSTEAERKCLLLLPAHNKITRRTNRNSSNCCERNHAPLPSPSHTTPLIQTYTTVILR